MTATALRPREVAAHLATRRATVPPLDVVLLGRGNVGGALLALLEATPVLRVIGIGTRRQTLPLEPLLDASPNAVLVDCTAAEGMEAVYSFALRRGAHVVTANKKPFVVSLDASRRLFAAARASGRQLRYETTVGAGLPVIEPLKDLVR